ncbi:DUF2993 domain-containing protein [Spirillospora sp. NPDC049024]
MIPRPSRRTAVVAAVAVLPLALACTADRLAADRAADRLAGRAGCYLHTADRPQVVLGGFPFLPQGLSGHLDDVRISARNVRRGELTVSSLDARLRGVRQASGGKAAVERVTADAVVSFSSLNSMLAGKGGDGDAPRVQGLGYDNGMLAVETRVARAGMELPVTVLAEPSLSGRSLDFRPRYVKVLGRLVPAEQLMKRLPEQPELGRELPELPAGLRYSSAEVTGDGVRIGMTADDVSLTAGGKGKEGRAC